MADSTGGQELTLDGLGWTRQSWVGDDIVARTFCTIIRAADTR